MNTMVSNIVMSLLALSLFGVPTKAGIVEEGFGGALSGAELRSRIGGHDGAESGAVIGGAVDVIRGVDQEEQRTRLQEAYQRQIEVRHRLMLRQQERERIWIGQHRSTAAVRTDPVASVASQVDTRLIMEVQKSLIRIGIDPGDVNGELHQETAAAIRQYERKHGLPETGRPSQELLKHMLVHGG